MNASNQKSINQEKSQAINRALIIDLLRQQGVCSRATLAHLSGLKQATITNIIAECIASGLVVETGLMSGSKGRRSIGITLNEEHCHVIGIRMTRSAFYLCLAGLSGKPHRIQEYPIAPGEPVQITLPRIRRAVEETLAEADSKIAAACMAMPGPYHEDRDCLFFVTELAGWQNYPIRATLTEGLELPFLIVNDANASAFAQLWYHGQEPATQNMLYVLAGQGVGCGIISEGHLVVGQRGLAGEFGHNSIDFNGLPCECGNRGCLEKYCSTLVLRNRIRNRLAVGETSKLRADALTTEALAHAVAQEDPVACEEYDRVCDFLSIGITNLINQFNPGLIVIGDELAEIAPDRMLKTVRARVGESVNALTSGEVTIEVNRLPGSPVLLGAAAFAAESVLSDPGKLIQEASAQQPLSSMPLECIAP